jgi:heme A synthase
MDYAGGQNIQGRGIPRVISLISLGLVFTAIIIGAYLSALGQGLSCSDWPLCPTASNLSSYGEYLVEYLHRIVAITAALFIYIAAFYAIKRRDNVRGAAIATAVTVSIQIVIGMIVVFSQLHPVIVAIHTGIGVLTLAFALITFVLSYPGFTRHSLGAAS